MRLILKQYLSSLKEDKELDAILPALLSQMKFNVFSTPQRGVRQYGVDIGAIRKINNKVKKVYLFSVKRGDLKRKDWNNGNAQDLYPSLNDIINTYIPTHLPSEYSTMPIVICICVGGTIAQEIQLDIATYTKTNTNTKVSFEVWDNDKIVENIELFLLNEQLLPTDIRPLLRKSLALITEPDASFHYFSVLVARFFSELNNDKQVILKLRQLNICLWIFFSWSRDEKNLEAVYLSAERVLLVAWSVSKKYKNTSTKIGREINNLFFSIIGLYQTISTEYILKVVIPNAHILHGLSSIVRSSCNVSINLKLFDLLGRIALAGIWLIWKKARTPNEHENIDKDINVIINVLKETISNNPTLLMPLKDEQTIDISLALLLLHQNKNNENDMKKWLLEITNRAMFAYLFDEAYPCILNSYQDLIEHPKRGDDNYRKQVTAGSILYPTIAFWAAILKDEEIYNMVALFKLNTLEHCNFQFWFPDDSTEEHFYVNSDKHGYVISNFPLELPYDCIQLIKDEYEKNLSFQNLSTQLYGLWPLTLIACRHYRLPIPASFALTDL